MTLMVYITFKQQVSRMRLRFNTTEDLVLNNFRILLPRPMREVWGEGFKSGNYWEPNPDAIVDRFCNVS